MVLFAISTAFVSGQAGDTAYLIDTMAGSDRVGDGGPAAASVLLQAEGVATDYSGNIYIADAADHRVRKISPDGIITTFAGTGTRGFSGDGGAATAAELNAPYGLAFDGRASLYIADLGNARVRRVGPDGTITTVAGGGLLPAGGANEGSPGTIIALMAPRNLAVDLSGTLYISDFTGQRVYRLGADGVLTTAAGTGIAGYSNRDALAREAKLSYPAALAVDRDGALYVGDTQNHLIRKVANNLISSFAFASTPTGLAFDGLGTLYAADSGTGTILVLAQGRAAQSIPVEAKDLAFGLYGSIYAPDGTLVRRISLSGSASVVAGGGGLESGDHGPAEDARLSHPSGVAVDAAGDVYIADTDHARIRRIAPDGTITTVAGTGTPGYSGDGGTAPAALIRSPSAVTKDSSGNLYIADTGNHRVRKVFPGGLIVTIAGTGSTGFSGDFGAATKARLNSPGYAIADAGGNVYIADTGNGRIRKVDEGTGVITTVLDGLAGPRGLAFDRAGNLYFAEQDGQRVSRLNPLGEVTTLGDGVWSIPRGVAARDEGEVFVADTGLQQILRVDAGGRVTVVAGSGRAGFSGDGGAAITADLGFPWDVASDAAGHLYIADLDNHRVRRLSPQTAAIAAPVTALQVLNAASLQTGPIAPGMLIALRGTGVTSENAAAAQILFDGLARPILAASDVQLVVRAPIEVSPSSQVRIEVAINGNVLAQGSATVGEAAPALFTDGAGHAASVNEDGAANSAASPLPLGSVISLYGTGLGVASPPVSATIGGVPAEILYAGDAPGNPGEFQINARVPGNYLAPGNLAAVVTAGGVSSQPGVTIFTK